METAKPYDRKVNESAKAYDAFSAYANLGPQRSLAAVGKELGKSEGLIERWSRRYDWGTRVRAFDAHLATVKRTAEDEQLRAENTQWADRMREVRATEWSIHKDCVRAVLEALKRFLENARRGSTLGDIARLAEVASKLGRLATGMPTDRTEITGQDGGPIQLEVSEALNKIYGEIIDVSGDSHANPRGDDQQILLLPRGDCTDPQRAVPNPKPPNP
jgi:hypothetical protein